jgi:hypothetical protein
MRRVSSFVRTRVAPAEASFPLISTSGGFPGEKKRSLIFGELLSIAASSSGVDIGAAAAVVAAVRGAEGAIFGRPFVGEDIEAVASFRQETQDKKLRRWLSERFSQVKAYVESTHRVAGQKDYRRYPLVSLSLRRQDLMQVRPFGGTIASEDRSGGLGFLD